MADILLLEPGYSNKYPPIGLMKIAYFHKYIHHDYVRFAKGKLPEAFREKKWDRVYVTTLFTFEWPKTKDAINYALSVVKDPTQVYTGGILATLMPELIAENFPTVKNNPGLLDKPGTLGLEHEECIDRMTLDYGILDDIADEYVYPAPFSPISPILSWSSIFRSRFVRTVFAPKLFEIPFISIITEKSPFHKIIQYIIS